MFGWFLLEKVSWWGIESDKFGGLKLIQWMLLPLCLLWFFYSPFNFCWTLFFPAAIWTCPFSFETAFTGCIMTTCGYDTRPGLFEWKQFVWMRCCKDERYTHPHTHTHPHSMDTFLWRFLCSACRDTRLLFTLGRAAWYVVRVQVSLGLSIRHMGSLIHGWVEVQISAIVTVCWWVDWDQKWLPWQPAMIRANLKTYFRSALSCPDLTKCPVVKGKQHVLFLPLHNTQQSLWHT